MKGTALIYDINKPIAVFGYIPDKSQTPKFVQMKKKRLADTPAKVPLRVLIRGDVFWALFKNKAGMRNPLHVNIKILVLPIIKSEKSIIKNIIQKLSFLPR
jgi:hypothetical protein